MSTINGSRLKILAMLFLFVPQESWDLQLLMFGYITCGFPRIFGYVLQVIKYSISVPLDRGGFGGWNLMLTLWVSAFVHWRMRQRAMCDMLSQASRNHARQLQYTVRGSLLSLPLLLSLVIFFYYHKFSTSYISFRTQTHQRFSIVRSWEERKPGTYRNTSEFAG